MRKTAINQDQKIENIRQGFVRMRARPDCGTCGGAGETPTDPPFVSSVRWVQQCGCLREAKVEEVAWVQEQYRRAGLKIA